MWYTPGPESFVQNPDVRVAGVGLFSDSIIAELDPIKKKLADEVESYIKSFSHPDNIHLSTSFVAMNHSWTRLITNPGQFKEKLLELIEFQRSWLELRGSFTFYTVAVPAMESVFNPNPDALDVIGTFTDDPQIALEWYSAGIVVFYVRKKTEFLGRIRIQSLDNVLPPSRNLIMDREDTFPVIFEGSPRNVDLYIAQHKYARNRLLLIADWPAPVLATGKFILYSADNLY